MPLAEIILIIMALLTVAMIAAGVCRNIPIPYTVFLVILGTLLGVLARSNPEFEPLLLFQLTPDLVLFLFLPALIFESAVNLNARLLLKDLAPVMVLAILALLISTAIIGAGLWLALDIPILLALLFGALISATDPVAVIALFKELGAPARLTILVEGESLLNDATAIVAFKIILGLILGGTLTMSAIGSAGLDFFLVFFIAGLIFLKCFVFFFPNICLIASLMSRRRWSQTVMIRGYAQYWCSMTSQRSSPWSVCVKTLWPTYPMNYVRP